MSAARILVAGMADIFLGDDAFGVEVAKRMAARPLPAAVRVFDFGIRGIDLTLPAVSRNIVGRMTSGKWN